MIQIRSETGDILRILPVGESTTESNTVEFHRSFGFVTPEAWANRTRMRRKHGLRVTDEVPSFSFGVQKVANGIKFNGLNGCEILDDGDKSWVVSAANSKFRLHLVDATVTVPVPSQKKSEDESKVWNLIPIIATILIMLAIVFMPRTQSNHLEEQAVLPPPVVVQIQPKTVVPVEQPKPVEPPKEQKNQALDKQAKVKKALTQTLGFLKMMGRKDLKKAIGGLPTNVPEASAGAGPGGNEGSGGQLLVGLGKGLRRTTVGNTGLAGLGGIGTKGAGGGLGGYGDTDYGSGAGQSLSTIPLAQDAVMEGGLDRSLIQATIMRYLSQIRACYEEGLKNKADLIGQVTMNFEISGVGGVNFSRVQRSSLGDRNVEECMSKRMMNWKFPAPRGGVNVKVSYPFMLRPGRS